MFRDGIDVWHARQLVLERLRSVSLPPTAATPELAPVSTGLGEIYQFVVRSDRRSPTQLRTLLDWEIVPKLRSVPGVIEVNTQGGDLKQYQVLVDRARLDAFTLSDVVASLRAANLNVGGGYLERRGESYTIRGQGMLKDLRANGFGCRSGSIDAHPGASELIQVRHFAMGLSPITVKVRPSPEL